MGRIKRYMTNFSLLEELMVEILLRLPVKSLLRFKSMCKSWHSLISDSQFSKSHFDLAARPTHRLLRTISNGSQITSLDFESSDVVHLKFPTPPLTSPHNIFSVRSFVYWIELQSVGYCRGFILLANRTGDVIVWNPSTGAHRRIPVSYDTIDPFLQKFRNSHLLVHGIPHGFGYDKSTDDYLLVLIQQSNSYKFPDAVKNLHPRIQVISLKTNISSFIYDVDFEYVTIDTTGLFLNRSLHWLVISKATRLPLVLVFDLIDRSLSEIPILDCVKLCRNKILYLMVLGECLCLHYMGSNDEIWVMKEYKVPSSWTRSSFVLSPDLKNQFWPICFTVGGALLASTGDGAIIKLNENGEVLEQHNDGLKYGYFPEHRYVYRESLLPLP